MTSRTPPPLVRVLLSAESGMFGELFAHFTHGVARLPIAVARIVPPTIREEDLLETAAKQNFDVAMLFLNHILFASRDRNHVLDDAAALVAKMNALFGKPIIVFHTWSLNANSRLLQAGAIEVFCLPAEPDDIRQAIKRCLGIW